MSIKPRLNIFDMTMITIGLVIGVAIYKVSGSVAAQSGNPVIFMGIWIFAGLISLIGALIFAEIGARIQVAGGFYKLFSITYAPQFSFILNWAIILTNAATVSATLLIGSESLLKVAFNSDTDLIYIKLTSFISCFFILALNLLGIRPAAIIEDILSSIKVILLLFIGITVLILSPNPLPENNYIVVSNNDIDYIKLFSLGFVPVFYAFNGYNNTINFGADLKYPKKNMPKSIIIGMTIVLFTYIIINYAYIVGLNFETLKSSSFPFIDLTAKYFGELGKAIVGVLIYLTVLGFVNAAFINNPRLYYAMAEDNVLPNIFKKTNPNTQTQAFSVLFFFILVAISILFSKSFESIVKFVILIKGGSLIFASIGLIVLRKKTKGYTEFRIKYLYILLPVYIITLFLIMATFAYDNPLETIYSVIILLTGIPLFSICRKKFGNL